LELVFEDEGDMGLELELAFGVGLELELTFEDDSDAGLELELAFGLEGDVGLELELAFEDEGDVGLELELLIWHLVALQVDTYILPLMPSLLALKNSSLKAIIS
jgi:hypothetical protein